MLVGFQRLAMQIIGALKSPINKKKTPMEWNEINEILYELRLELGLSKYVDENNGNLENENKPLEGQ